VGIPGVTGSKDYDEILLAARKHELQWVAQERFEVVPVACEEGNVFPCVGVYTVDGKMAGLYGRAARQPIVGGDALDVRSCCAIKKGDANDVRRNLLALGA